MRDEVKGAKMDSIQNPLRIAWIAGDNPPDPNWPELNWSGRLGLTIAPGKKGRGQAMAHDRDLGSDMQAIQAAGTDLLVNLMEQEEMQRWHMHDYHQEAARIGLCVRHFPIPDGGTPSNTAEFCTLVDELYARLQGGETIVIHCLGGLGRSGMLAACMLVKGGMNAHNAIELVRQRRSYDAVEAAQPLFVKSYAQLLNL